MMNNQLVVFGQANIKFKHMLKMIKLLECLHTIFGPFPGTTTMTDTKKFIGVNEVIERLICVFHAFVKDVGEDEKEEGDGNVTARDDESEPLKFHDQKF